MGVKAHQIEFLLSQVRRSTGSLAGGTVTFYAAGTTTKKTIWTSRDKGAPNEAANPYTLDSNGTAQLYADGLYKVVIKSSAGTTVYTRDNLRFSTSDDNNRYYVDASAADQTALASSESVQSLLTSIGTSKNATIIFDHTGTGNTTTYTVGANADWSTYGNVAFEFKRGAILSHGAYTVKMPYPVAEPSQQIFSGTGAVTFYTPGLWITPEWFGAIQEGIGGANASPAIQSAVNALKATSAVSIPIPVVLLSGKGYALYSPIDCTGTPGIALKSLSGRYHSAVVYGHTGAQVFDFTGSPESWFSNIDIYCNSGMASYSTIGLQFARSGSGIGNNPHVHDVSIALPDDATKNGGIGTIGILNTQSEEADYSNLGINANVPLVFSYTSDLNNSIIGSTFTITSVNGSIGVNAAASMGVMNIVNSSLVSVGNAGRPGIWTKGTNSMKFAGYMAQVAASPTLHAAIMNTGYTGNQEVFATIEGFSTILFQDGGQLDGLELKAIMGNQFDDTKPLINFGTSVARVIGINAFIAVGDSNRKIVYQDPGDGDTVTSTMIGASVFTVPQWSNGPNMITQQLLRRAGGVRFNCSQPWEKTSGGVIKYLGRNPVSLGTVGTPVNTTILKFSPADRATTGSGNAGYYTITIDGYIEAGNSTSTHQTIRHIAGSISVAQKADGTWAAVDKKDTLLEQSASDAAVMSITAIALDLTHLAVGAELLLKLLPTVTGTGTTEPLTFDGAISIKTGGFTVNETIPYA